MEAPAQRSRKSIGETATIRRPEARSASPTGCGSRELELIPWQRILPHWQPALAQITLRKIQVLYGACQRELHDEVGNLLAALLTFPLLTELSYSRSMLQA